MSVDALVACPRIGDGTTHDPCRADLDGAEKWEQQGKNAEGPIFVQAIVSDALYSTVRADADFMLPEGFGAMMHGGAGGTIIEVTNLNDNGAGSLRAALQASEPRIIRPTVAGWVDLTSHISINNPYFTLERGPGNGLGVRYKRIQINTHDGIVCHLRAMRGQEDGLADDCITMQGAYNMVFYRCTFAWGSDEIVGARRSHDIAFQWCLFYEGLPHDPYPSHGLLLTDGCDRFTLHHCLIAHCDTRPPRLVGDVSGQQFGVFDLCNNVVYDWGADACHPAGYTYTNIVNNYFRAGPETVYWPTRREVALGDTAMLYIAGNIGPSNEDGTGDNWFMVSDTTGAEYPQPLSKRASSSFAAPAVTMQSATDAYADVLAYAGAWPRTTADERIISDVEETTGGFIADPSEVGGWPEL